MLGKVQFELQKLVDSYVSACNCFVSNKTSFIYFSSVVPYVHFGIYWLLFPLQRAHIFLTITNPSESLLNELRTVEVCFIIIGGF